MTYVTLGSVARVRSGFAFKSKDWEPAGVPVIKIANLGNGRVTLEGCSYVSVEKAQAANRFALKSGDVLVAMSGVTLGGVGVVRSNRKMMLNQRVGRIEVASDRVDLAFIGFALQDPRQRLRMLSYSYGAAQPNISPDLIESLPLWLPHIEVQRSVADLLSGLDSLIENNRRRIEILEEMARLLYREWFVHFRFPGHEDVGLVDSELGPIPEGWEVGGLTSLCSLVMGQSPKSEFYNEHGEGLPFHQGVTDFGFRYPTHRKWTTVEKRVAEAGDILFSVRAPVGRINVAPSRMVVGRGLSAIRSLDAHQEFMLLQLKDQFAVEDSIGGGTIFNAVTKSDMERIRLLRPPHGLTDRFEEQVVPMSALGQNLTRQNECLREARDLLLPRLVSGELDVSELDLGEVLG